jgi:hypothetical protein
MDQYIGSTVQSFLSYDCSYHVKKVYMYVWKLLLTLKEVLFRLSALIFNYVIFISIEFFLNISILEIIAWKNLLQYQQQWNQPKVYNKTYFISTLNSQRSDSKVLQHSSSLRLKIATF